MIRYRDLDISFSEPEIWRTDLTELNNGPRWTDILSSQEKLVRVKESMKKDLELKLHPAIDHAKTEDEIGNNLTPIIEVLSKGFFVSDSINEELLLNKANKNTLQKKLQVWAAQLNYNAPFVKKTPGTKIYHNAFKGIPAVIVAAGPSLKNSIEKLKSLKGKALIMSVDTSFRSCMKRGIFPDFCNAHDAGENGWKFFKDSDCSKTIGLFVNYIHPQTIASYKGPLCFYYVDDPGIPVYKTMALACDGQERPDGSFMDSCIIGGSSVAHTAMYAAVAFGCNPITFVGLDLSFPDLTKSHFESDNMKNLSGQRLIDVMGVNGRKIKTNLSFYSYATVMNRMVPWIQVMRKVKIFNSSQNDDGTPAGIVHFGLEPMKFDDWIEKYAHSERKELSQIQDIQRENTNGKFKV